MSNALPFHQVIKILCNVNWNMKTYPQLLLMPLGLHGVLGEVAPWPVVEGWDPYNQTQLWILYFTQTQDRSRACNVAQNGGSTAICTSADTESQSCSTNGCRKSIHVYLILFVEILILVFKLWGIFFKLLMPSGLLGAPGEAVAKHAAEGWELFNKQEAFLILFRRNNDQETAMWPNMVEAHQSARAPRQHHDLATTMDAVSFSFCRSIRLSIGAKIQITLPILWQNTLPTVAGPMPVGKCT